MANHRSRSVAELGDEHVVRPSPRATDQRDPLLVGLVSLIAIAAGFWFLRATFSVTMPLAFGFVLAILLTPVQRAVARKLPGWLKWLGTVAAVLTLALFLAAVGGFLAFSFSKVSDKAPEYDQLISQARQWSQQIGVNIPALTGQEGQGQEGQGQEGQENQTQSGSAGMQLGEVSSVLQSLQSAAWSTFSSVLHGLTLATLIFFFMLLMLLEANPVRSRFASAFGSKRSEALDTMDTTAIKVREYLWVRTLVSLISGALAAVWFLAIGLDLWYLWGFLFFALNYIPFVGSLIAGIPPVILAFITGGVTLALLAAGGVLATENIIGNFLDPKLQGKRLALSPVVLLASLTLFFWAWSWPGVLLAVPLTAFFVVALAHIEPLKPVALLLSNVSNEDELEQVTHGSGAS